jgi:AraC-like DNA-binding protein
MTKPDNVEQAAGWLRRALTITKVDRRSFGLGQTTRDEIITTNRFILILRGELRYTVEGRSTTLRAGTEFLVPAWVRRVWSVPRGGPCEIVWCEFDSESGGDASGGIMRRTLPKEAMRRERGAFASLLRRAGPGCPPWAVLHAEAALKVMLVRFFEGASRSPGSPAADVHPRVKVMLRWLQENFRDRDVLERLYEGAGLTPNYFRALFRRVTLCNPHEYIERLRLRHARHLLHHTAWQLKRIAAEAGYDDPLYFSRLYRRFWKRAPSEERRKSRPDADQFKPENRDDS